MTSNPTRQANMMPSSRRFRPLLAGALAAVVTLATTGCSAESPGPETRDVREPPIQVQSQPATSAQQIDLPLARYLSSPSEEQAYFSAVNVEQKQCASSFGVTTTLPVADQPSELESVTIRRYGTINADEVARFGYQFPPSPRVGDDRANGWNPTPRELAVMNGRDYAGTPISEDPETGKAIPEGGCAEQGFRVVNDERTPPSLNNFVIDLLGEAWSRTMADSRALEAAKKWSACMTRQGYSFTHRWDAGQSVAGTSQETQLAMAKLDLSCAEETGYINTWYAVDTAYQAQLIEEHEGDLEAILSDHAAVMNRVNQVLQGK